MRFCEAPNCNNPVFSTCKISGKGYCRNHQYMKDSFDRRSILQRGIDKHKEQQKTKQRKPGWFDETLVEEKIEFVPVTKESFDCEKNNYPIHDEMVLYDSGENGVDESIKNMTNDLDYVFSLYIRNKYADKNGMVKCFCCPKVIPIEKAHNSHYIKRGNSATRFLEANCRPSCPECNQDHNYDEIPYTNALEAETPGITSELKELSKIIFKPTRATLKSLLIEYRHKLELVKRKLK